VRLVHGKPTEWNDCPARLEAAVAPLRRCATLLGRAELSPDPEMRAALLALRKEIRQVSALLDSAAALYGGWMRLAQTMAAGYSADGSPAGGWTSARVSAEG
jgi:hypothetical protein